MTLRVNSNFLNLVRDNLILNCFCSFFLALFIVPLWKFNSKNKKKHIKIYNLFASLDVKIIINEIKKLDKIET